ncbi:hypothetical protein ACI2OX_07865 [Bacillus sp. N9]
MLVIVCGDGLLCVAENQYEGSWARRIFAIAWVAFALIVVAGNLSALLFAPKRNFRCKKK